MLTVRPYRSALLTVAAVTAGFMWLAAPATAKADTFAAIAYSEATGKYGYSYNYATRDQAQDQALVQCNADDAKIIIWARNAWVALAVSDNGRYGSAWGTTEAIAKSIAMQKCRDGGGTNPRIAVSVASGG